MRRLDAVESTGERPEYCGLKQWNADDADENHADEEDKKQT